MFKRSIASGVKHSVNIVIVKNDRLDMVLRGSDGITAVLDTEDLGSIPD